MTTIRLADDVPCPTQDEMTSWCKERGWPRRPYRNGHDIVETPAGNFEIPIAPHLHADWGRAVAECINHLAKGSGMSPALVAREMVAAREAVQTTIVSNYVSADALVTRPPVQITIVPSEGRNLLDDLQDAILARGYVGIDVSIDLVQWTAALTTNGDRALWGDHRPSLREAVENVFTKPEGS